MRLTGRTARTALIFTGLALAISAVASVAQTPAPSSSISQNAVPTDTTRNGLGSSQAEPTREVAPSNSDQAYYRISTGDTLDITVFGAPDLAQKVRVTSNGDAYLPLVNYVHVAGLNVEEAQRAIEYALQKGNFLTSPHVSIFVAEYANGVVVMGEVAKPGVYPVTASKGLLFDILTEAGGPSANAGQVVTITHRGDIHQETVLLSQNPQENMEADVPVYPGDTIMVAKAGTLFVVGEVLSPNAFVMEKRTGYTALKALAMAKGPTKLAKLSQAIIIRQTKDGVKQIPVPLDKIAQSKAPDTELLADDILMVPTNHAKSIATQGIAMAQTIAVWGVVHSLP